MDTQAEPTAEQLTSAGKAAEYVSCAMITTMRCVLAVIVLLTSPAHAFSRGAIVSIVVATPFARTYELAPQTR